MDPSFPLGKRLHDFYHWWTTGLFLLLPAALRKTIEADRQLLTIESGDRGLVLRHATGTPDTAAEEYTVAPGDELEQAAGRQWLGDRLTDNTRIQLLIPADKVLHKRLTLPRAAQDNLRQVLAFEMDRRTPFRADQVYFDYVTGDGEAGADQLHIELYLTPRTYVDPLLASLQSLQLSPHMITGAETTAIHPGLNLLPADMRPRKKKHPYRSVLALSVLACLLALAVLYVPIAKQYRMLEALENEIEIQRDLAVRKKTLEEQRDKLLFNTQFLTGKQNDYLPVIALLDELTRILPDHTWLTRLTLARGEVQLQGESETASAIIELMESAPHFNNTRFISPVTRNEQTRKDKFNLSASIAGTAHEIAGTE